MRSYITSLNDIGADAAARSALLPKNVVRDLKACFEALNGLPLPHEVSIDDSVNELSLEWLCGKQGEARFCLTFGGTGAVIGTLSPYRKAHEPWRLKVDDLTELSDRIAEAWQVAGRPLNSG